MVCGCISLSVCSCKDPDSVLFYYLFIWLGRMRSWLSPMGPFFAVHGLSSCGAAAHRLSWSTTHRILVPGLGIEPSSCSLQGRFLTTGPPGKPQDPNNLCRRRWWWKLSSQGVCRGKDSYFWPLLFLHRAEEAFDCTNIGVGSDCRWSLGEVKSTGSLGFQRCSLPSRSQNSHFRDEDAEPPWIGRLAQSHFASKMI